MSVSGCAYDCLSMSVCTCDSIYLQKDGRLLACMCKHFHHIVCYNVIIFNQVFLRFEISAFSSDLC